MLQLVHDCYALGLGVVRPAFSYWFHIGWSSGDYLAYSMKPSPLIVCWRLPRGALRRRTGEPPVCKPLLRFCFVSGSAQLLLICIHAVLFLCLEVADGISYLASSVFLAYVGESHPFPRFGHHVSKGFGQLESVDGIVNIELALFRNSFPDWHIDFFLMLALHLYIWLTSALYMAGKVGFSSIRNDWLGSLLAYQVAFSSVCHIYPTDGIPHLDSRAQGFYVILPSLPFAFAMVVCRSRLAVMRSVQEASNRGFFTANFLLGSGVWAFRYPPRFAVIARSEANWLHCCFFCCCHVLVVLL